MRLVFAILALTAIVAAQMGADWLHWLSKPTATLVLLVMLWPQRGAYSRAVRWGLAASAAGDAFLMLPQDLFLPGLASFFVAHLAYIHAFTRHSRLLPDWWVGAGFAVLGVGIITILWPGLPAGMGLPVCAYAGVLALMAAQALGRARTTPQPGAWLAAIGAMLFLFSDTALAINRFVTPLPLSPLIVLGSYYAAQACIAGSALVRQGRAR